MMRKIKIFILIGIISMIIISCNNTPQPKPYAYFRIDIPDHDYILADTLGPYNTEISVLSHPNQTDNTFATNTDEWINITYPTLNATIHLSYKTISKEILQTVTEESRSLAYKHTIRADAINESFYGNDTTKVYGILYEMEGNAASPAQFYVTDSTKHFLRGSLYFNHTPNADSIAPAANYVLQDMIHLIETLNWK